MTLPDPDDPKLWTTLLSPDGVKAALKALGDSATAYWTTRPDADLIWEMQSSRRQNWPVRFQIARSLLAARKPLAPSIPQERETDSDKRPRNGSPRAGDPGPASTASQDAPEAGPSSNLE